MKLEGFKIAEEGKHHITLMHPSGHKIKIAKGALSPAHLTEIKKMADGGDVDATQDTAAPAQPAPQAQEPDPNQAAENVLTAPPETPSQPEVNINIEPKGQADEPNKPLLQRAGQGVGNLAKEGLKAYGQYMRPGVDFAKGLLGVDTAESQAQAPPPSFKNANIGNVDNAPQAQNADFQTAQMPQDPYGEYRQGLQDETNAIDTEGRQEAQNYENQTRAMQTDLSDIHQKMNDVYSNYQTTADDVANGKIDTSRVWNKMDTGHKALAALGLLFGGVGSGITHQENGAAKVIQSAIDNDIQAQKEEMNNKRTLLGHYMEMYGNLRAAETATRLDYTAMMDGMARKYLAQAKGPIAQAKAKQIIGMIDAHAKEGSQQLAAILASTQTGNNAGGQGQGYIPSASTPPMDAKDYNERRVNLPTGGFTFAPSSKVAEKINESNGEVASINDALKTLQSAAMNNPTGIHVPLSEARSQYQAARGALVTSLNSLLASKRLMESEIKIFEDRLPNERDWFSPAGQAKLSEAMRYINSIYTRRLQTELGMGGTRGFSNATPIQAPAAYKTIGMR